jgi:hypothetical protein
LLPFYGAGSVAGADDFGPLSGVASAAMGKPEFERRAEHHAQEAERLLAGRLGIITNYVKAGVHATLAVYYANRAQSADSAGAD